MSKIKFFINERESGMTVLAEQMREVGIDFSSIPTFGPPILWVNDQANYGSTAVCRAVQNLIEKVKNKNG